MSISGKVTRAFGAAAATVMLSLSLAAAPAQADGYGTIHGCPEGWVCLYPGVGWNKNQPSAMWYTYGAHNLTNQWGMKRLFNNQTGEAFVYPCLGYNGVNCGEIIVPLMYADLNFDPINSVLLTTW